MDKPETLNDLLTEEAKQARREYHAKWQREHPEQVRKYHADYWNRKAARIREERKED